MGTGRPGGADAPLSSQLALTLFRNGVSVAIVATVLSVGMAFPAARLMAPLRRVRLVVAVVVLNTIVLPAAAWATAAMAPLSDGHAVGLVLAAVGSAGGAGLKAAQLARRADLPLAVALVVVLQLANLVAVPLWAAAVVTGSSLDRGAIARNLLVLVLLPLVLGTIVRARFPHLARRLQPLLMGVGNVALAVALVGGISANWDTLLAVLGTWVLPTALAVTGLGLWLGLLVGGADGPTRTTTSLVSGTRFSALGLIIVGTQFPAASEYLAAAIAFSLVDVLVMLSAAVGLGRRGPQGPGTRRRVSVERHLQHDHGQPQDGADQPGRQ